MSIFLKKKNFYLLILIISILTIFFTLYIEYILQYKACKLCLYQRIPYLIAIFISFIGFNYYKNDKILLLIILIFSLSFLISGYHYGIEKNIFVEFSGCATSNLDITDKKTLLKTLSDNIPNSCKDVNFKLFGISLAGINSILSLLIVIYSLRTLIYEKN
tara:strand:- start:835 stop:1314 length:480 start_codon:yes stop_codon:yes gene_type:complete